MVSQVSQLANDLPRYKSNLTDKIQSLQGVAAGTGPLERASDVLKDLKREIEKPGNVSPANPPLVARHNLVGQYPSRSGSPILALFRC